MLCRLLIRTKLPFAFDMVAMETVTNQYLGGDTSLAYSAETQAQIDRQVVSLIKKQHEKARTILQEKRKCRFVNDVLQIWERKKNLFRGTPIKRPHREVIVLALANSELLLEIMKGKELV